MKPSGQLSRDASALLDEVRAAEDPTGEDEARVKAALAAAIAAGLPPHWERDPPLQAGAAVAKAGTIIWAAPAGVLALCAAALFVAGEGQRAASTPAAAPSFAPGERSGAEPGAPLDPAGQHGQAPATPHAPAVAPDAGASNRAASAAASDRAPVRRSRAAPARPASNGLAAELALLQRAQAALRRADGESALRELDAFGGSGGQLLAERRAARVLALCSLGRVAEARALAAELLRAEPSSVQRAALERSCANPSRMGER